MRTKASFILRHLIHLVANCFVGVVFIMLNKMLNMPDSVGKKSHFLVRAIRFVSSVLCPTRLTLSSGSYERRTL